jgi:dTDP-4-amino-4,6-dideoxygalactose transaminase
MGRAAAFSFYPGKNLGACGEAGAITTDDEGIARTIRMLRDHGQSRKYHHEMEGYNGRLDSIQAGILGTKLTHLDRWNQHRRERASLYDTLLTNVGEGLSVCAEAPWAKSVYHLYVVRVHDRDRLMAKLAQEGIGTGIHYPIPLHLQPAYRHLGYKEGDFPVAERLANEIVSLPMYPHLTAEQQYRVVEKIQEFLASRTDVILSAA